MQEVKRLINLRFILISAALLFANALFLIRDNYGQKDVSKVYDRLVSLAEEYKSDDVTNRETAVMAYNQYKLENGITSENIPDTLKEARTLLMAEADYVDGYKEAVKQKIETSTKLIKAGIYKRNSFENINILKTRYDMNKVKDVSVTLSNGRWLDVLYNYSYIQIFSMILLAITVYGFFLERKTGLYYIVHTGRNGRVKLFFKRFVIISAEALIVNIVLYIESALILLNIYGGINSINDLASSSETFFIVGDSYTRAEMAVIFMLVSAFTSIALSLMLWVVLSLFSNINIGMCVYIVVCVIFMLIHLIVSTKSPMRFAHYLNLYYWFYPHKLIVYHNWGYSFGVTTLMVSMLIFTLVLSVIFLSVNLAINEKKYFTGRANVVERLIERIMSKFMGILVHAPQFLKEVYKTLISQKVIFVLAVLMYFVIKTDVGSGIMYDAEMSYLAGYYNKASGMEYSAQLEEIYHQYELDYEDFISDLDENDSADLGKMQLRKSLLAKIRENIDYVKELNEKGISAQVIKPYEYTEAFGSGQESSQGLMALINVIAVIAITAGYLSYERKSKIYRMAVSCSERRKWLVRKIFANTFLIVVFFCVSYGIYYYKLFSVCKVASFSAHIKSLPMFSRYPINAPVAWVIVIDAITKLIMLLGIAGIVSVLSKYIAYLYCLIAGLVIVFPQLLSMMGFSIFDNFSIGKYIAFFPCFNAGGVYIKVFVAVLVFLLAAGSAAYISILRKTRG